MIKYRLSALQRGFLSGRSIQNRLGGVPCHVYIEAGGKNIDIQRLTVAWKKVLYRHPLLRCKVEELEYLLDCERSPNEYVQVFDFSSLERNKAKEEQKKVREEFSGRLLRTEYGHTCGLGVMKLPKGTDILFFDFDLTAGDVYSFQIILSDLARFYCGGQDSEVIMPYIADLKASANKKTFSEIEPAKLSVFKMPVVGDAETLYGCKYKSIRFSYPKNFLKTISEKFSEDVSEIDIWRAVSALTVHHISDMESFFMNIPHFRSDLKSVSDNTELYLVYSYHSKCEKFGDYLPHLVQEIKNWHRDDYPDGFEYHMSLQKKAPEGSRIAPVVFSSTEGIMLLTEEFEKAFGKLEYMVSQTPQVWIDMQYFTLPESTEIFWMIPQGLFDESVIAEMMRFFRETVDKLGKSENPAELYI